MVPTNKRNQLTLPFQRRPAFVNVRVPMNPQQVAAAAVAPVVAQPQQLSIDVPSQGTLLPGNIKPQIKLYQHQIEGIAYLCSREYAGLFDGMGMGKTAQLIYATLAMRQLGFIKSVIVVIKRNHERVWRTQLGKHAPGVPFYSIIGQRPDKRRAAWPQNYPFYLVNYELLSRVLMTKKKASETAQGEWQIDLNRLSVLVGPDARNLHHLLTSTQCAFVLDESHRIKNPTANITRVLDFFGPMAARRYIATGTPAAERPDDVFSQVRFLDGGKLLGRSYDAFIPGYARFQEAGGRRWITGYRNLSTLKAKIQTLSIRRMKEDCLDLPAKYIVRMPLAASEREKKTLMAVRTKLIAEIKAKYPGMKRAPKLSIFKMLQPVLSTAAAPWLRDPSIPIADCTKLNDTLELLDQIGDEEQLVIWTVHVETAEAIAAKLNELGIAAEYVHYEVSPPARRKILDRFDARTLRVLVTTSVLAEAETLTTARNTTYLERNYGLMVWLQSQDRVHRIGTTAEVTIRVPLLSDSLDDNIDAKLLEKEANVNSTTDFDKEDVDLDELYAALKP